ncbi:2Fe-2S iron-sulfur cluster-binding protein [Agarivorans sp. TSD2052]|uniref:2Fe-2S iron-sulfur cluster-binding protein n=1 Tax=Agarivorans sp. TSD2052 TaxID=2937286 RepID=UPI0020105CC0|nr:2Fe-2S iron-sulfur cluster-binding protein [Agarivorans sp. TSD2052]UPW18504.1 2Fe-2S iron-sulfur cluster-binding protein [Agarivorans sp. TSD2052]
MAKSYKVEMGQTVFWVEPQETLLNAATRQGVKWPYRCGQGACLSCLARCISGTVSYHGMAPMLSEAEQTQGWFAGCLASAETDLYISLEG